MGIKFTVYKSSSRLSKWYGLAPDGKTVIKKSFTQLSSGRYRVEDMPDADIPAALRQVGATLDALTHKQAIGLGVPLDGTTEGYITTKRKFEAGDTDALPRDLAHFGWPEHGLLFFDGDDRDGLFELLCGLYPAFADVAALMRPSVSACVVDPQTGKKLKTGEHVYVVIDQPERSRDCLFALMRLAWVLGDGAAAGWLMLSKRGDVLVRGPIDAIVGSPERLSYEGAGDLDGLTALPRVSQVIGGAGMLNADNLIAFADRCAPPAQVTARIEAAKNDPTFIAKCATVKADYRATQIRQGTAQRVAKGVVPAEAEKQATEAYEATSAAGICQAGKRKWIPLADDHELFLPDGTAFTIADIKANPAKFNAVECADPQEGLDYQSRNPAIIYTNHDERIEIYSRAHGDAFAYVASLDETPWAELFVRIVPIAVDETGDDILPADLIKLIDKGPSEEFERTIYRLGAMGWTAQRIEARIAGRPLVPARLAKRLMDEILRCLGKRAGKGVTFDDFYAYMPRHQYIFAPTGEMWPAASVNSRLLSKSVKKKDGTPALDSKGKPRYLKPNAWLDKNRPVEQMAWAPGEPQVIANKLITEGGWIERPNVATFNLYRPPVVRPGNAVNARRWIELGEKIYPKDFERLVVFGAHRIQHPEIKINHGKLMGGSTGIGKDTLLEPFKHGVGPWNFKEVSPQDIMGIYNDFMRSVILRISEARDLGEFNRYTFHNHMKTISAAPPDAVRVNAKYIPHHYVMNVTGAIYTTNHRFNSLYLPPNDRRTDVMWSESTSADFNDDFWREFWGWYYAGGLDDVVAYLRAYDLRTFDPKAPPPKTEAFWQIVGAGAAPEESELADVIDKLGNGAAITLDQVMTKAGGDLHSWLRDRKNRRTIPHKFEACNYVPVRNPDAKDGYWVIGGKRQTVYGRLDVPVSERFTAVKKLLAQPQDAKQDGTKDPDEIMQ